MMHFLYPSALLWSMGHNMGLSGTTLLEYCNTPILSPSLIMLFTYGIKGRVVE